MASAGLIIQHHREGAPARFVDWLDERGMPFETVHRWRGERPPADLRSRPWVAVLGSWHSAAASDPEWIAEEVRLLGVAARADVPVLGVCFGSQALALALGGRISPSRPPSIGWFPLESEDPALVSPGPWFHYNYEVFSIPPGATEVTRSPAGPSSFTFRRSFGIQFHPEATPQLIKQWASADRDRLTELNVDPNSLPGTGGEDGANRAAFRLFDAWRERILG